MVRKESAKDLYKVLLKGADRNARQILVNAAANRISKYRRRKAGMVLNGMEVRQANGLYYVFTEYGELKSIHYLPEDGQLMADFKAMDLITKAEALRWGIIKSKKK